jgi:hypothetical protein
MAENERIGYDNANARLDANRYRNSGSTLITSSTARIIAALGAAAVILALVVISPLALKSISSLHGFNWIQLSYVGQTYGAASALLSGLALIGVSASIILQARAVNVSVEQSSREHHAHLVELALDEPAYQRAWGANPSFYPPDGFRQRAYLNLIVSHWQRDYQFKGITDKQLRGTVSGLFQGEAARLWWASTGEIRVAASRNRRDKRFCRIVDEEFREAVASGPPLAPARADTAPVVASRRAAVGRLFSVGGTVLFGAAVGAILEWSYRRTKASGEGRAVRIQ